MMSSVASLRRAQGNTSRAEVLCTVRRCTVVTAAHHLSPLSLLCFVLFCFALLCFALLCFAFAFVFVLFLILFFALVFAGAG